MSRSAKRILVADDEETIRRLLDYNLRKFDFEPVLAANGREAIALAQGEFACALIDLKMPELDGMGVLSYLKQHFPRRACRHHVRRGAGERRCGSNEGGRAGVRDQAVRPR